jgi:hypothetical protein
MATVPAYPHSLSLFPHGHVSTDGINDTDNLMAGHAGIGDSGKGAELHKHVAVTNATSLNPEADLSRPGLRNVAFHQFERSAGPGNLYRTHPCHGSIPFADG